jgi:hypothetical protein
VDGSGNLLIADDGNGRIRKVDGGGIITTLAGNGSQGYRGEGGAATNASLFGPSGVAVDPSGNVFIADQGNNRIRKVDTNGTITTAAGNGVSGASGDGGAAANANVGIPHSVAVDVVGNLFIVEENLIRKVGGIPEPTLTNVSASNTGVYRVIVSSPYGSVTSPVATLTIVNPTNQPGSILMTPPFISATNLLLGFTLSQGTNASFTLLQTPNLTGSWTTNTTAVLTTNAQTDGFQFSIPTPGSVEFYQVRSP